MRARRFIAIVLAALVPAALSACGGSPHGLASKDPQAIVAAATRAIEHVRSVRVSGTVDEGSRRDEIRFDLRLLRGRGATGRVAEHGLAFRMVTLGDTAYVQGTPAFWLQFGGTNVAAQLHGRWLRAPADHGDFASFASLTRAGTLIAHLLQGHGALSKGTTSTIDGRRVIAVHDASRQGTLYVATSGPPYPIRLVNASSDGARIDFGGFDAPVRLRAPARSVSVFSLRG
ncbi:MAG TPA: hypothetical protein VKV21_02105 [Solirubrobacteraceae bacterium]|nr:hypothetical protein [Solirubrobacteraceae bacterium]